MKKGDVMIYDPRSQPLITNTAGKPRLQRALLALGLREQDRPLIATPAARPRHIINAKADGTCHFCAAPVWVSSSHYGPSRSSRALGWPRWPCGRASHDTTSSLLQSVGPAPPDRQPPIDRRGGFTPPNVAICLSLAPDIGICLLFGCQRGTQAARRTEKRRCGSQA